MAHFIEKHLTVQDISLIGRDQTGVDEVLEKLDIQRDTPLFALDLTDLVRRLEELPWVQRAVIGRHLNGHIRVTIEEKKPIAIWQSRGEFFLIDQRGHMISQIDLKDKNFSHLLLISGYEANHHILPLFHILEHYSFLKDELVSASYISERRWDLYLKNGAQIKLPEENVILAIEKLNQNRSVLSKDIQIIDLRIADKMILNTPTKIENNPYKKNANSANI